MKPRFNRSLPCRIFCQAFKVKHKILVGAQGIPVEEFLPTGMETWTE